VLVRNTGFNTLLLWPCIVL